MRNAIPTSATPQPQQGIVLVVCLIMLLILTLVGVAAMNTTSLEEKMAGNANNRKLAFEAAESALRAGETWIQGLAPPKPGPVSDCTDCTDFSETLWTMNALVDPWSATIPRTRVYAGTLSGIPDAPRHYVEYDRFLRDSLNIGTQRDNEGRDFYRVTSRGTGGEVTAASTLQSIYARRY